MKLNKKIKIKRLGKKDVLSFRKLIRLFNEVFESKKIKPAGTSYLKTLLGKSNFIALAIFFENEMAGGLTAYELPLYTAEYSEMYIYDMAIKTEFQRKGFGQKIISALKKYCKENKIKTFFVEAHQTDQYAVNFYKKAGGKAENVVHFNFKANG